MIRKALLTFLTILLGFYLGVRTPAWFGEDISQQIEGFFEFFETGIISLFSWAYEGVLSLFN